MAYLTNSFGRIPEEKAKSMTNTNPREPTIPEITQVISRRSVGLPTATPLITNQLHDNHAPPNITAINGQIGLTAIEDKKPGAGSSEIL